MAVDASQILLNRELGNFVEANGNIYNTSTPMGYGNLMQGPLSGTTTATDGLIPMYDHAMADSVMMAKTFIKSESGLSYAVPISRKRPRGGEAAVVNHNNHHHQFVSFPPNFQIHQNDHHQYRSSPFTFLGEDLSGHFQHEQSEIDRFIAQHAQKVRMEIEEKRKSYSRRIIAEVEDVIVKKLRSKEEEIEKIGKVNLALEERVKSLCVENQIWRELAQTNEATANALRSNLEQILVQLQDDQQRQHHHHHLRQNAGAELADDAQSCCGSNCIEEGVAAAAAVNSRAGGTTTSHGGGEDNGNGNGRMNNSRMCRNCWKEEANVLIMPCRHLCVCHACGPLLHNCPICNSVKNVMVRVNLIPS